MTPTDKLIFALDVDRADEALAFVRLLKPWLKLFKIGNQLFTREGPAFVKAVRAEGVEIFLDQKWHDIPQTVASAVKAAVALDARYVTVHASGGLDMLRAAQEAVKVVTPGVRSGNVGLQDQKRTLSAVEALKRGANHLVIGRPITKASDPVAATQALLAECGLT